MRALAEERGDHAGVGAADFFRIPQHLEWDAVARRDATDDEFRPHLNFRRDMRMGEANHLLARAQNESAASRVVNLLVCDALRRDRRLLGLAAGSVLRLVARGALRGGGAQNHVEISAPSGDRSAWAW